MLARGQVYIGLIISMAILAILSQAIITLVFSSYDLLNFTSARTTARYIAQEKMENIRNLPYLSVGTQGGIPTGNLLQFENISRNGLNYEVRTSVIYVDDPFDGIVPNDLLPTDYKRVRIEVGWTGLSEAGRNPISLVTDVAPKDIEQAVDGGTLSIFVLNAEGAPLPGATALIEANTNPAINLTLNTGATGRVILPGAPACASCYQITISRDGYSSERTYATTEVATPTKPHQSVIAGSLTEVSFAIDQLSTMTLTSLPSQGFLIRGEKTIGTDAADDPVYKFSQTVTTNSGGQYVLNDLEWDTYHITKTSAAYDVAGTNPLLPLALIPASSVTAQIALSPHTTHSLLATFLDSGENQIASVTAQLKDSTGEYVATASAGTSADANFGQVFFPSLSNQAYTLETLIDGFANSSTIINVVGNLQEIITLLSQ